MLYGIQSFLIILGVQEWYILMLGLIVAFASLLDRTFTSIVVSRK